MNRITTISVLLFAVAWHAPGALALPADELEDILSGSDAAPMELLDLVMGDFDSDGIADWASSADGSSAGSVIIVRGSDVQFGHQTADPTMADLILEGNHDGEEFGASLAVGDVDGDEVDDLLIGAPGSHYDHGGGNVALEAGRVYVYLGADLDRWSLGPSSMLETGAGGARLGEKIAVGDLMGNPVRDDVAVCASGWTGSEIVTGQGGLFVFKDLVYEANSDYNPDDATVSVVGSALICSALAVAPDMVGDAENDLVVGDIGFNGGEGIVMLLDMEETAMGGEHISDLVELRLLSNGESRGLGSSLAVVENLDGLGGAGPDLLVGAPDSMDGLGRVLMLDLNDYPNEFPGQIDDMYDDAVLGYIDSAEPYKSVGCDLAVTEGFGGIPGAQVWIGAWDSSMEHGGGGAVGMMDVTALYALSPQSTFNDLPAVIDGSVPEGHLGTMVRSGDIDGDGQLDVMALAPDTAYGTIYMVRSNLFHDYDGDGYLGKLGDCDDGAVDVHPFGEEVCDGLDSDCIDGPADDEWDDDGDGFMICDGDCDDSDPHAFPRDVEENCDDGVDNDCDGDKDHEDADCGGGDDDDDDDVSDDDDVADDDAGIDDDDDVPAGLYCQCSHRCTRTFPAAAALGVLALAAIRRRSRR